MNIVHVDKEVDCSGMLCPMPIVMTTKAIKELEVGQVLKIVATDAGAPPDMQAWSRQTGHELLEANADDGIYTFYFRRSN
jgi:tRNA 2-thiouridine synthesizing protein A